MKYHESIKLFVYQSINLSVANYQKLIAFNGAGDDSASNLIYLNTYYVNPWKKLHKF